MQEWYLMTPSTRPNITGGFENDSFLDYKEDAFIEALQTDIAKTVTLYYSDLTKVCEVRMIISGNLANTQLKSLERAAFAQIGTLKAGMYVGYENRYWLVSGYPGNNGICEKATLILCQYQIMWQDETGKIIKRWANFTSASRYDVGENGYNIVLSSNNFTIWIPEDDDGQTLDGKRIFIERPKKGVLPKKVYKITRSDDVLYLYGEEHGGILSFIADKTELNLEKDRPDLQLCDYVSPITPTIPSTPSENPDKDNTSSEPNNSNIITTISGGNTIRCNRKKTWSVNFTKNNESITTDFEWKIKSDFEIPSVVNENTIQIKIEDENLIGETFILCIYQSDKCLTTQDVEITDSF